MTEGFVLNAMVMGSLLLGGAAILAVGGRFDGLVPPETEAGEANWLDHVQSSSEWRTAIAVAVVVVGGGAVLAFAGDSLGLPHSIVTTAEFVVTGVVITAALVGAGLVFRLLLGKFDVTTAGATAIVAVFVGVILVLLILHQFELSIASFQEGFGL